MAAVDRGVVMKFRVLLGALVSGLIVLGSSGAHAERSQVLAADAAPVLLEAAQTATFTQDDQERGPLSSGDQALGDGAESDSEEICTVLMVLRGPAYARGGVAGRHRALGPTVAAGPPVPPPKPWASIFKNSAKNISIGLGATGSPIAAPVGLSTEPSTDLIREPGGCGSLPQKTTSAWDLDDDPASMLFELCESGEPDSEVCTVLMVWRGAKRAIVEATRLATQAPFPSILPPVPPPQRGASTADFELSCAPERASVAAGDIGPLGPAATPQPYGCDPLPKRTTSAWDLDDDPESTLLCESDHSDSEVCTVLMVWRGAKRAIVEAPPLATQAPFPSILPPVPPPQRDASTASFAFPCAPETGSAAARDFGPLDSQPAEYPNSTSVWNSSRQDLVSRDRLDLIGCAPRSRADASEPVSNRREITTTNKIPSKGSTLWGTL
jgi:hypothetical protein